MEREQKRKLEKYVHLDSVNMDIPLERLYRIKSLFDEQRRRSEAAKERERRRRMKYES